MFDSLSVQALLPDKPTADGRLGEFTTVVAMADSAASNATSRATLVAPLLVSSVVAKKAPATSAAIRTIASRAATSAKPFRKWIRVGCCVITKAGGFAPRSKPLQSQRLSLRRR